MNADATSAENDCSISGKRLQHDKNIHGTVADNDCNISQQRLQHPK
jgi:hypothetical protein